MIRSLINELLGKRHHWRVQLIYRSPGGVDLLNVSMTISMNVRCGIDDHRRCKISCGPTLIKHAPKHLLCNGSILIEPKVYLGWW